MLLALCVYEQIIRLNLFRMDLFAAAHGWGRQKGPLAKTCNTYTTMMKFDTAQLYLT